MEHAMKRILIAAGVLAATIAAAAAQPYPARAITMVVPFGAGGPTDALARIIAERMRVALGEPVLVENVTGASGTIGITRVARAVGDGYTIVLGNWPSFVVASATYNNLSYDVFKDFEPIALLPNNPYIIVTKKSVPAKDLKELIAYLKANPDKVSAGTGGNGAGQHVSGLYFQKSTGTTFQFVPYRAGSSDIMRDLVAGHIDLTFDQAISALPYVRNDQVRAYAITARTRLASAPDIPTVDEAGAPGVYISTWFGLWAPKGTPAEAIAKLSAAAREAMADPAVAKRLADLGQEIPPSEQQTPAGLAALLKSEMDKWGPIIKAANIKAD
jgi:tripartite-type tricarboxylate transporter receptor subunit TctC